MNRGIRRGRCPEGRQARSGEREVERHGRCIVGIDKEETVRTGREVHIRLGRVRLGRVVTTRGKRDVGQARGDGHPAEDTCQFPECAQELYKRLDVLGSRSVLLPRFIGRGVECEGRVATAGKVKPEERTVPVE